MWRCDNCRGTTFIYKITNTKQVNFDKEGNMIIGRIKRFPETKEKIVCEECGIYSDCIYDLASWVDEEEGEEDEG